MSPDGDPPTSAHLTAEEVAAYLDHASGTPAREQIEAHLATCNRCLAEVAAALRFLRPPEGRTR
ncbi:MAG: zf-HC2 domain-containing protein [Gemmatimonadales bacterium]|nr:zf-HC2 domain-containing protein [Gemmatimonadales bacterium]